MTTGRTGTPGSSAERIGTLLVSVILIILCHPPLTSSSQESSTTDGHLGTDLQPLLIQILYRHGARSPVIILPGLEKLWPMGPGQLTGVGREQQIELGSFFRRRYIEGDPYKHLSPEYMPDELYVRSSDIDRALASAYSNLAGMYPPEPEPVEGQLVYSWQPIPVHTRLYDTDFPIGQNSYDRCPKFVDLFSRIGENIHIKEILEELKDLLIYISNQTEVRSLMTVDVHNGSSLFSMGMVVSDSFQSMVAEGYPIPDWATEEWNSTGRSVYDFLEYLYHEFLKVNYAGDRTPLIGGPTIGAISNNIVNKLNGSLREKMIMISGHDSTLVSIILGLDLDKFVGKVPFAASIIFELLNTSSGPVVRLLYRGLPTDPLLPLQIHNCTMLCPVDQFFELIRSIVPENWDEECERSGIELEINLGFISVKLVNIVIFAGTVVLLLLLIEAAIFLCIIYKRSQKLKENMWKDYKAIEMNDVNRQSSAYA